MGELYIFRGLPGAGKSYRAKKLANELNCLMVEPDMGCYQNGEYQYEKKRYEICTDTMLEIVSAAGACDWNIVVADVFATRQGIAAVEEAYGKRAKAVFWCDIDVVTSIRRNLHQVAERDIRQMERDWRPIRGEHRIDGDDELIYDYDI